jgi:hypothetical protein
MDDVEVGRRVTNLVAVLGRMSRKVGGRDLDALQECLRLAGSVPGLREGPVHVRLAEADLPRRRGVPRPPGAGAGDGRAARCTWPEAGPEAARGQAGQGGGTPVAKAMPGRPGCPAVDWLARRDPGRMAAGTRHPNGRGQAWELACPAPAFGAIPGRQGRRRSRARGCRQPPAGTAEPSAGPGAAVTGPDVAGRTGATAAGCRGAGVAPPWRGKHSLGQGVRARRHGATLFSEDIFHMRRRSTHRVPRTWGCTESRVYRVSCWRTAVAPWRLYRFVQPVVPSLFLSRCSFHSPPAFRKTMR